MSLHSGNKYGGLFGRLLAGMMAASVLAGLFPLCASAAPEDTAGEKNIVIVIDPGHGGSNIGGQIPGIDEKNATLVTALAMKEELEKYEGVTVYMTRTGDTDLSLEERVNVAGILGADFLFSLHFNKAVPNRLYGAEVWIPSLGENYAKSYACGDMVLNELCDTYGLYRRGIKTKVSAVNGQDYYGVIKYAGGLGIPSMIIEHCHIDNEADIPFFNSPEKLVQLGRMDATGVAKYFGLKSSLLGVDYSGIPKTAVAPAMVPVIQDMTPPETAAISSVSKNNGQIRAVLQGMDSQSGILYYDYSLDGGLTWSSLQKWNSVEPENTVTIPGVGDSLTVRIYNQYDLATQSAVVPVP